MFNWIRKKPKKDDEPKKVRFGPEEIADEDLEGLRVASLKYVVGIDGQVYIEFFGTKTYQKMQTVRSLSFFLK